MSEATAKLPRFLLITGMPVLFARVSYTESVVISTEKRAFGFKMSVVCASLHWKRKNFELEMADFLPYPTL
jgi:hypothetical protein